MATVTMMAELFWLRPSSFEGLLMLLGEYCVLLINLYEAQWQVNHNVPFEFIEK